MALLLKYLWTYLVELNIFESDDTNDNSLHEQRFSTRLYIIGLSLAVSVLLIVSFVPIETYMIEVENPSYSTYANLLIRDNSNTPKCPCTDISSTYGDFVQMTPYYHQVCSSNLVSSDWINFLFDMIKTQTLSSLTFEKTASYDFQVLRELCQSCQSIINDSLLIFYSTQLISKQLLSEQVLNAQIDAVSSDFHSSLIQTLNRSLSFVQTFTLTNGLISAANTAFAIFLYEYNGGIAWSVNDQSFIESDQSVCSCAVSSTCHLIAEQENSEQTNSQYYMQGNNTQFIADWYVACWPIESLLLSSLATFYNQSALDIIANTTQFSALHPLNSMYFNISTIIDQLVNNLFVEKWITNISYSSYYNRCEPHSCFYQIEQHQSVVILFTTLAGLSGGLSLALRLLVSLMVKYIFRFVRRQQNRQLPIDTYVETPLRQSTWVKIDTIIFEFNLFKSVKHTQSRDLKQQRWSTRLFLISLCIALFILTTYNGIHQQTRTLVVNNPSLEVVEKWQRNSFIVSSLQCPCLQISSTYKNFISLTPKYHQICSSDYITWQWINGMEDTYNNITSFFIYFADFRGYFQFFQMLQSLCTLATSTISNALVAFGGSQLVTADFISRETFENQLNSSAVFFKQSTVNDFLSLMHLLSNITQMNQYLSGQSGNFNVQWTYNSTDSNTTLVPKLVPRLFYLIKNGTSLCFCLNETSCRIPVGIFTDPTLYSLIYAVPGLYMGCWSILSLYVSTLECFYDDNNCLGDLDRAAGTHFYSTFTRLNSDLPSRFLHNSTIGTLLENLFIESWTMNTSFENYFNACAIQSCSYTVFEHHNMIEIVIIEMGLTGGISRALMFTMPWIVMIIYSIIGRFQAHHRQQRQLQPTNRIDRHLSLRVQLSTRLISIYEHLVQILRNINLFSNPNKAVEDQENLRLQHLSTRIYIILLATTLVILGFYSSLTYTTDIIERNISTVDDYVKLKNEYNGRSSVSKFECLCQTLSVVYSSYIHQLETSFHEVCASPVVNNEWLQILFESYTTLNFSPTDAYTFKGTTFANYQALALMCNLVKEAVDIARTLFLNSILIVSQVVDQDQFEQDTKRDIEQFQKNLPNNFNHVLKLARGLNQANGLVSVYSTNWRMIPVSNVTEIGNVISYVAQYYEHCNCATTATCHQRINNSIPGYVAGCVPLESMLQSTIECHYNLSCIQSLYSHTNT